jgi:hypothetical protein
MSENDQGTASPIQIPKTKSWLTGKWSPLCRIIENSPGKRWSDLCRPDSPGVYRLIALDPSTPGTVPASLDRVCGIDLTGTLYIGATSSLRRRLASLVLRHRTDDPLSGGSGGYQRLSAKLARRFPRGLLAISWQRVLDSGEMSRERALFHTYKARFGELPPMNDQSGI